MLASILAIALQIVISLLLVAWTKGRVRKQLDAGSELARVRRELGALMAEMEASADRNVTILEDRLNSLKELVAEADRRIALSARESGKRQAEESLRAAMERDAYAPVLPDQLAPAARADGSSRLKLQEPAAQEPAAQEPQAQVPPVQVPSTQERAPARGQEPAAREPVARAAESAKGGIPFIRFSDKPVVIEPPFADKAAELAKRGFSSDLIAARLGSTLSEVELALALSAARERKRND